VSLALARPSARQARLLAALAALGLAALLSLALALPALAHTGGEPHSHERSMDERVRIDWDGTATEDCRATGEGTILWTLTGSDAVLYAELHIDEPVESVTVREGGPYLWISPLYPLDEIEADVDWVDGPLADGARLTATTCAIGGAAASSSDTAGLLVPVGGGVLAGGALGLLVGSRRRSA
jgi:hypothetical protein